jgi:hypothetical protein
MALMRVVRCAHLHQRKVIALREEPSFIVNQEERAVAHDTGLPNLHTLDRVHGERFHGRDVKSFNVHLVIVARATASVDVEAKRDAPMRLLAPDSRACETPHAPEGGLRWASSMEEWSS